MTHPDDIGDCGNQSHLVAFLEDTGDRDGQGDSATAGRVSGIAAAFLALIDQRKRYIADEEGFCVKHKCSQ